MHNKVTFLDLLMDSKIHILAISTIACSVVFHWFSIGGLGLFYGLMAMWMMVDYRMGKILQAFKNTMLSFVIPAIMICLVNYILPGEGVVISTFRVIVIVIVVMLAYDLLRLPDAKILGLVMAVVVEVLIKVEVQTPALGMMLVYCLLGGSITLAVSFVYYSLVDYSAYLKYSKSRYNEQRVYEMIKQQLLHLFNGEEIDWKIWRTEFYEFRANRFFYNRKDLDLTKIFCQTASEIYIVVVMLRQFNGFDATTIAEAKKILKTDIKLVAHDTEDVCHYENVAARGMLVNFDILRDLILKRAGSYTVDIG